MNLMNFMRKAFVLNFDRINISKTSYCKLTRYVFPSINKKKAKIWYSFYFKKAQRQVIKC